MVWVKATYEFASLFSYRIPDFSSQYASSSILPGPSAIKLAVVYAAIETTGNVNYGKEIFEIVKRAEIKIRLPRKVALSNVFIKRLKQKKGGGAFESTFGMRGYVHIPEKIDIYLKIPEDRKDEIKNLLRNIRRFGTSDSLVWCRDVIEETPPSKAISPVENLERNIKNIFIIPIKDLNPEAKFDDINIYEKKKGKNIFLKKIYPILLSTQSQGKNWIVYEFT